MCYGSHFENTDPGSMAVPAHSCPKEAALSESRREIRNLRHILALLWSYLVSEDVWDEAWDYIQERHEYATPFDFGSMAFQPFI